MILAEAVSIDGGTLVLILVALFLFFAACCALVTAGFVWAARAGRGSRAALAAWLPMAAIEAVLAATVVPSTIDGRPNVYGIVAGAVLAGQVVRYQRARNEPPADAGPPPTVR